mmetsp:Transcript_40448/g.93927  ORF Transcript_40448/g.93927 Transcript_40448/m.93927 type:complete len:294 (-) Transcript_40448:1698-2579(-)
MHVSLQSNAVLEPPALQVSSRMASGPRRTAGNLEPAEQEEKTVASELQAVQAVVCLAAGIQIHWLRGASAADTSSLKSLEVGLELAALSVALSAAAPSQDHCRRQSLRLTAWLRQARAAGGPPPVPVAQQPARHTGSHWFLRDAAPAEHGGARSTLRGASSQQTGRARIGLPARLALWQPEVALHHCYQVQHPAAASARSATQAREAGARPNPPRLQSFQRQSQRELLPSGESRHRSAKPQQAHARHLIAQVFAIPSALAPPPADSARLALHPLCISSGALHLSLSLPPQYFA